MFMLPVFALMLDAARVIEMRLLMMALGRSTPDELFLMLNEKLEALGEAGVIMITGGNPTNVVDHYQKIVSANVARLSSEKIYP